MIPLPARRGSDYFVAGETTPGRRAGGIGRCLAPAVRWQSAGRSRPTVVSNTETFAHVGLIGRFGPDWFRQAGSLDRRLDPRHFAGASRSPPRRRGHRAIAIGALLQEFGKLARYLKPCSWRLQRSVGRRQVLNEVPLDRHFFGHRVMVSVAGSSPRFQPGRADSCDASAARFSCRRELGPIGSCVSGCRPSLTRSRHRRRALRATGPSRLLRLSMELEGRGVARIRTAPSLCCRVRSGLLRRCRSPCAGSALQARARRGCSRSSSPGRPR